MSVSTLSTETGGPLLAVSDLRVVFSSGGLVSKLFTKDKGVRAVDGVSLEIAPSEIVGIVGESGSGKTTLALAALGLTPVTGGQVLYGGEDITRLGGARIRRVRRNAVMIFQDPHSSLSPRMRVSSLLMEPYSIHKVPESERYAVAELLEMVELPNRLANLYPHELSGGQARRVGIARALSLRPKLIVADEPTTGLDVSAASSILNLLQSLRELRDGVPHHHPRPQRRRIPGGPDSGHVPGQSRRVRPRRTDLRCPAPSLHKGVDRRHPGDGLTRREEGVIRLRGDPEPSGPTARVPLSSPLPVR